MSCPYLRQLAATKMRLKQYRFYCYYCMFTILCSSVIKFIYEKFVQCEFSQIVIYLYRFVYMVNYGLHVRHKNTINTQFKVEIN